MSAARIRQLEAAIEYELVLRLGLTEEQATKHVEPLVRALALAAGKSVGAALKPQRPRRG